MNLTISPFRPHAKNPSHGREKLQEYRHLGQYDFAEGDEE
jgi:hypothetical protein